MISLEADPQVFSRAKFNLPYNCIDVKNMDSTAYLTRFMPNDTDHNIFWLDFVSPSGLGAQLADYTTLLERLNPGDIVRITLNANPDSLGKKSENPDSIRAARLETLRSRVKDAYLPPELTAECLTRHNYPITLLKILKAATLLSFEYSANFLFPLFSTVYADGQQMLTFTGIILNDPSLESRIRDSLKAYPHNAFSWDTEPSRIEIPALSVQEISELNKRLPITDQQTLMTDFPFIFDDKHLDAVNSYIAYYKYYPNYHLVSF